MGRWVSGKLSGVQPIAGAEGEKKWHRRTEKMGMRWPAALSHIHIRLHDPFILIHVIPVEAGAMIPVFAKDPEPANGRFVSFASRGNMGHGDHGSSFVEFRFLRSFSHENRGLSRLRVGNVRHDKIRDGAAPGASASDEEKQTFETGEGHELERY